MLESVLTYGQGIISYDASKRKTVALPDNHTAAIDYPIALFNDRNNNLWIGTEGNGVCGIDMKPKKFNLFPINKNDYPELTRYFIKSICEDGAGKVWFSTHGNGFFIFDKDKDSLSGNTIAGSITGAIFRDKDNNMWVSGNSGIFLYTGGQWHKIAIAGINPGVITDGFVSRFLQLSTGDIIAATSNGPARLYEQNGVYKGILMKGFKGGKISDMIQTPAGDLWISVRYTGIERVTIDHDVFEIKETHLPGSFIGGLHLDEADPNQLWVCADKGLIRFSLSSKSQQVYNEQNGMANSHVYGILEDEAHNLWISTNGGICHMDRKSQTFKNYTVKDGLQSNEFNSTSLFKNNKGILYFGGVNGFNWFSPLMPAYDTVPPLLDIAGIAIDDTLIKQTGGQDETITVSHTNKSIAFSFVVLDYTQPEANMIAYTLNDENKWHKTYNKTITYSNLSPGAYTLRIKGINSSGMESDAKIIQFTVLPPFWKTYWFGGLLAVAAIAIIILITRNITQQKLRKQLAELEQQREIEKERQRISREMHDDIGAGLTQITLMSEMAKNRLVSKDQKELNDIASTSRKLVNSMSEIIWSLNPEGRKLERFFGYLRENLNHLLEYSGMDYSINFPDEVNNISLSDEQRRNILLIVKEAVNNAVKYSKADLITINAALTDNELSFEIIDDGIGFDPENRIRGNGMSNMDKRVLDLNGSIKVQSRSGDGVKVYVSIPLKSHSAARK